MTDLATTVDTWLAAYGDPDDAARRAVIERTFTTDAVLSEPPMEGTGHDGIDEVARALQGLYPGHAFRRTSGVDEHHGFARYEWAMTAPDGTVALVGTDAVVVDDDGRLRRIVGFLGPVPALA